MDMLKWAQGSLDFSGGCLIMGVLNITPDSFSDGGRYFEPEAAVEHGIRMARDGAAIIDVGAESTRPGSAPVPAEEQIRRAIPVIRQLVQKVSIPISIDTADADVAEAAIEAGAAIINDTTALTDDRMARLAAGSNVPVILMHMQGTPATMQQSPHYNDVVSEVLAFLLNRAARAESFGIPRQHIIIDPGIGFGKTFDHNVIVLHNIRRFVSSGYRVLVGASRKRFLSHITGRASSNLAAATAAVTALCADAGAAIVRAHDVAEMVDVCRVIQAIRQQKT
ncbi:MAG TPA: dihydropteroate synthase [Sedimentisphaerales bacterium]|nr:dihydropteroate synthase [Sedimentisphaerales bacterium]